MKKWLCVFLGGYSLATYALVASVDRTQITRDDTLTITFTEEAQTQNDPDFFPLQENFVILNTEKSTQITVINNQRRVLTEWHLSLLPKKLGTIEIPSIQLGTEKSEPLQIHVVLPSPSSKETASLFIETEMSPSVSYPFQEVLYIVKVFYSQNIANANLSDPRLVSANFLRLGDDIHYQTSIQNKSYQVMERRYAIFPQQSGKFDIVPPELVGQIETPASNASFFDPFKMATSKPFRKVGQTLHLNVLSTPVEEENQWLPAHRLVIEDSWGKNPPKFKVGEPVSRELTITAYGLPSHQLPTLEALPIGHIKVYPDKPTQEDNTDNQWIIGKRTFRYAMVPTQEEQIEFPPISIQWWNTETNKPMKSTIPAIPANVLPAPSFLPSKTEPPLVKVTPTPSFQWKNSALFCLLGLFGLGALLWIFKKRKTLIFIPPVHPFLDRNPIKETEKILQQACINNDSLQVKKVLCDLMKLRLKKPIQQLDDISKEFSESPSFQVQLSLLKKQCYGNMPCSDWNGEKFWNEYKKAISMSSSKKNVETDTSPLPPLYL